MKLWKEIYENVFSIRFLRLRIPTWIKRITELLLLNVHAFYIVGCYVDWCKTPWTYSSPGLLSAGKVADSYYGSKLFKEFSLILSDKLSSKINLFSTGTIFQILYLTNTYLNIHTFNIKDTYELLMTIVLLVKQTKRP